MANRWQPVFNGVTLTDETIQAAREWFAENARECINDAKSGAVRVNDLGSYVEWQSECIADSLAGKWDHTFTFLQRAHSMQTGDCIALLAA